MRKGEKTRKPINSVSSQVDAEKADLNNNKSACISVNPRANKVLSDFSCLTELNFYDNFYAPGRF